MTVIGAAVSNSRDAVSHIRVFGAFLGNLVEFRQSGPGAIGAWLNHGSPAPSTCIGLPSVALIDNSNPARQLRVFFPATNMHLMVARFAAGTGALVFDDHTAAAGGPSIGTAPGGLIIEAPRLLPHRMPGRPAPVLSETYRMYMGSATGTLLEHKIVGTAANLIWTDFGMPGTGTGVPASAVAQKPGAPYFGFRNPKATAGVFVTTASGSVFEFILEGSAAMSWVAHGAPAGIQILSEPHALMIAPDGSVSSFYVGSDSNLYQLTAPTTGTAGSWFSHGEPKDSTGLGYDLTSAPAALMVVPSSGDVFFRFLVAGTSNIVPTGPLVNLPEDRLFEGIGDSAPGNFTWIDDGPAAALPLGFNPAENLFAPRGLGENTNGAVDPHTIFIGTSADRLLEFDLSTGAWLNHGTPPRGTPCGPRSFSVGFGG